MCSIIIFYVKDSKQAIQRTTKPYLAALVLDDDVIINNGYCELLEGAGFDTVVSARNIPQAMKAIYDYQTFDVCVIDKGVSGGLDIAHRGGLEVASRLRQENSGVFIIITSGESGLSKEMEESGANLFFPKTTKVSTFTALIGYYIEGRLPLDRPCQQVDSINSLHEIMSTPRRSKEF